MSKKIEKEHKETLSRVFKRNLARDMPIYGLVLILCRCRDANRLAKMEQNRDFALKCLAEEKKEKRGDPVTVQGAKNVTHLTFVKR